MSKYLLFSDRQNVSTDIVGTPNAAAVVEGTETHTRTVQLCLDLSKVPGLPQGVVKGDSPCVAQIPMTQAVVYGWYDNELGSYSNLLGDLTVKVAKEL